MSKCINKKRVFLPLPLFLAKFSAKILEKLDENGRLLSMDKDRRATSLIPKDFIQDSRFKIINDSFSHLSLYVENETVNGILIDLGIC